MHHVWHRFGVLVIIIENMVDDYATWLLLTVLISLSFSSLFIGCSLSSLVGDH